MYTSIVVPLDGSAFGKRALPVALALARRSDAEVHLVHVHEPMVDFGGAPIHDAQLHVELSQAMRKDLTAIASHLTGAAQLRVDAEFLDGPVIPTLQRYVANNRHDLIVMMTHGRGGPSRTLLGSVADGVVRRVKVPVLLVRHGSEWPGELVEPLFCHVLVPLDGSVMAEEVLDYAISLATPDLTVYTLLTVVVPRPDGEAFSNSLENEREHETAQAHLLIVATELRESGAIVKTRVVTHELPAQGILDAAEEQRVDSIALSTRGRRDATRLRPGGVADIVIRGATVPVLVRCVEGDRVKVA